MLINPYTPEVKLKNFPDLYKKILLYYDYVYDTIGEVPEKDTWPRDRQEEGRTTFKDAFYYIDMLYDSNPTTIVDIGCGEAAFKKWFPRMIGFDTFLNKRSQGDFIGRFNRTFSEEHHAEWDCGMALNSIHFVNWIDVPSQITWAMDIVKYRLLATFNFQVISDKPTENRAEFIPIFTEMLKSLPYKIVMLDYPELRGISSEDMHEWSGINGSVRFILEHQ
jgi:hypothetical protein